MSPVEPERIQTGSELSRQLALLFDRDPRGVHRFAADAGLGTGTVQALITGHTAIPRMGTLERFVRTCGQDPRPWLAARARLVDAARTARRKAAETPGPARPATEPSGRVIGDLSDRDVPMPQSPCTAVAWPRGAVRVSEADWRALSVHAPIQVPDTDPEILPVYVPRDIDEQPGGLRPWLRSASGTGGMLVMVGGSSTGKSRCLLEAITTVLPRWWLLRPADPKELADLAADPPRRLVLWLDELQQHLGDGGLTAAMAGRLISTGSVLVGTLWPSFHQMYSAPPPAAVASGQITDAYGRERELLKHARILRLPDLPSTAEVERAHALAESSLDASGARVDGDLRLREALRHPEHGFAQIIAAAPQLADRWDNAPPYARAVLTAAVDAVRLGVRTPLPQRLLRDAAPGYCTPVERAQAPPDWFEQARAYTTGPLNGATAALTPVTNGMTMGVTTGYRIADYLVQHALPQRRPFCPPGAFWRACAAHLSDPADTARLGIAAHERLRYHDSAPLLQHGAPHNSYAAVLLASGMAARGDEEKAIALLRPHADNDPGVAGMLVDLLAKSERLEDLGILADAGDEDAAQRLADILARRGDEEQLRALADAGDPHAAVRLVDLLVERLDVDQLQARANSGDLHAARYMAGLYARVGKTEQAIALLRPYADNDPRVAHLLVDLLAEQGDVEQLRDRANSGDRYAARQVAKPGEIGQGISLLALIHSRDRDARQTVDLLAERGDAEELRIRADAGDPYAAKRLADLLAERGDVQQLRALADAGDPVAAGRLVELLVEQGDVEQLRARVDTGDVYASWRLHAALRTQGRDEEADRLREFGLTADGAIASGP